MHNLKDSRQFKDDDEHQNEHDLRNCSNTSTCDGFNSKALELSPMPMNGMRLDESFHQEHIEQLDDHANKWWMDYFHPQEFLFASNNRNNSQAM